MDAMYLQSKSFMDRHPDVKSIKIEYNHTCSGAVLSMRCFHKDSGRMVEVSKAIWYEDLPCLSENDYREFTHILSMMYDECQYVE